MKQRNNAVRRRLAIPIAVVTSMGIASWAAPAALASTPAPLIQLPQSSLQYGYTGPLTILVNGTGTHFNSSSIAYVLTSAGVDTGESSAFNAQSPTTLTFSLASGLQPGSYQVEVKSIEDTGLEVTSVATLTVSSPSATIKPLSLPAGYADNSNVTAAFSGMAVSTSTRVALMGPGNQDDSSSIHTTVQGNQISLAFTQGLAAGSYSLKFTDGSNPSVSVPFTITQPPLQITTMTLPAATANQPYSASLQANQSGVTWSKGNPQSWPSWLSLSSAGALSGTPTQSTTAVTLQVNATPQGGGAPVTQSLLLTFSSSLNILTTSLPDATTGSSYSAQLQATEQNVTWSFSPALPSWLQVDASGDLSSAGVVPDSAKTFSLVATAKDANGSLAQQSLTLKVKSPSTSTGGTPGGGGTYTGGSGNSSDGASAGNTGTSTGSNSGAGSTGDSGSGTTSTGGTGKTGTGSAPSGETGPKVPQTPQSKEFNKTLQIRTVSDHGALVKVHYGASNISITVPSGAISKGQLFLSAGDAHQLSKIAPRTATTVAAFGVRFTGSPLKKWVTITVQNKGISANSIVYSVDAHQKLVRAKATVHQGVATLVVRANEYFVIVTPVHSTLKPVQKTTHKPTHKPVHKPVHKPGHK